MDKLFKSLYVNRELHAILFEPVCKKFGLTLTEIHVLLFLAEHDTNNTAKDIVGDLKITKSYVSGAVHTLEERGYIEGCHEGHDRRSVHLHLCEAADEIIKESKKIQSQFLEVLVRGFSGDELAFFKRSVDRMIENTEYYLKECSANKN